MRSADAYAFLALSGLSVALAGCGGSGEIGDAPDQTPTVATPDDGAALATSGSLTLLTPSPGRTVDNGFAMRVAAPARTRYVVYSSDEYVLAVGTRAPDFAGAATFTQLGARKVVARAFDASDRQLAEARIDVVVREPSRASLTFARPAVEGGTITNGVRFEVEASTEIVEVRYVADGWSLGRSSDAAARFGLTYTFSELGARAVTAEGLDASGQVRARATRRITVVESGGTTPSPGVGTSPPPYFYQYANTLSPGSSCQNTSIAMVLASLGWRGVPDDITRRHGKTRAQSTAGLAAVFGEEAARAGLGARLQPTERGTLAELRALLRAGRPVIVHGYFTDFGHVMVAWGFDGTSYTVNDPAGTWSQRFGGGYRNGWEPTAGRGIRYPKDAFELAIGSFDGVTIEDGSLWYHELR
jgi:hypothetical protein